MLHTEGVTGSFPLLETVSGDLTFTDLGTTGGGSIVEALTSVGGELAIRDSGAFLEELALGAPAGVEVHALALSDNTSLDAWSNANWHVMGSGAISIVNNPSLPACAAEDSSACSRRLAGPARRRFPAIPLVPDGGDPGDPALARSPGARYGFRVQRSKKV